MRARKLMFCVLSLCLFSLVAGCTTSETRVRQRMSDDVDTRQKMAQQLRNCVREASMSVETCRLSIEAAALAAGWPADEAKRISRVPI